MSLKVRPFSIRIEEAVAEGVIEGAAFVCRFYGRPFPVPTTSIGRAVVVAVVDEVERPEQFGYTFKVEADYEEDFPPGCRISLYRDKTDLLRALARKHGIAPDSTSLVGTWSESISVYFDFDGNENGSGRMEPSATLSNHTM